MMESSKKLTELRVVDLRSALEARGLEKSGVKSVLIDRLAKAMVEEGLDPDTQMFTDASLDGNQTSATELAQVESSESVNIDEDVSYEEKTMMELDNIEYGESVQESQPDYVQEEEELSLVSQDEHEGDVDAEAIEQGEIEVEMAGAKNESGSPVKSSVKIEQSCDEPEDPLVLHVDESDTNLDYDLGDKADERDAPTPTKDESMDQLAADSTNEDAVTEDMKPAIKTEPEAVDSKADVNGSDSQQQQARTSSTSSSKTEAATADTPKKDVKDLSTSQHLWISGLSSTTRATDLKSVFSKYGKVVGAKVVTNAHKPGSRCYGFVTMSSAEEAAKCIQNLHRTDLHGKMISVERAKSDPAAQVKAVVNRKPATAEKKSEETASGSASNAPAVTSSTKNENDTLISEGHKGRPSSGTDRDRRNDPSLRRASRISTRRSDSRKDAENKDSRKPSDHKSSTDKPEDPLERERRRLRVLERRLRDDDARRRQLNLREKRAIAEQGRRLKMEELRMDRERERMRMDREKVKIDQLELERLERERARLERELVTLRQTIDREREELRRVETLRLEEMRRASLKRTYEAASRGGAGGRDDVYWDAKRQALASNERYVPDRRSDVHVDRSFDRSHVDAPSRREAVREPSRKEDRRSAAGSGGERRSTYTSPADRGDARRPVIHSDRRSPAESGRYSGESRRTDWKTSSERAVSREKPSSTHHGNGTSSGWAGGSSRSSGGERSGWSGRTGGGASASSATPSLLSTNANLFTGSAAAQAAGMMMNAAALSRSGHASSGSSNARFSASGGSSGFGRRY